MHALEAMGLAVVILLALALATALAIIVNNQRQDAKRNNPCSSHPVTIQVEGDKAYRPRKAHIDDAGWDVRTAEDVYLKPGERALISTGIKLGIPKGYCALALPRSGTAHKLGVTLNNAPGLIDAGYQGTVYVNLINHGDKAIVLHQGDRIAQLLIQPVTLTRMMPVDALTGTTQRGTGGHGSTGTK